MRHLPDGIRAPVTDIHSRLRRQTPLPQGMHRVVAHLDRANAPPAGPI